MLRTKYTPDGTVVPQNRRAEINQKILYVCDTDSKALPDEVIFNCYTGIGGLHGLDFKDFTNYHDFSEAKKDVEAGQFFTPAICCEMAVRIAGVTPDEKVVDACCGMGNFFNYCPVEKNCFGFDLDPNAVKVARRLYPEANLRLLDIRQWMPDRKMDVALLNPPFNLDFLDEEGQKISSQLFTVLKCAEALETAGLLVMICPVSFLENVFWNKSDIDRVSGKFSFIGQCRLPSDAFRAVGVDCFETKLMVWYTNAEALPADPYDGSFCDAEELEKRVAAFRERRFRERMHVVRESLAGNPDKDFQYELKKLLFQIKAHPATKDKYDDALRYYEKYRTQKAPEGLSNEEFNKWYKYERITPAKVTAYCRKILRSQNPRRRWNDFHVIYDRASIRVTTDNPELKKILMESGVPEIPVNRIVTDGYDIRGLFPSCLQRQVKGYASLIRRKQRRFAVQDTPLADVTPSKELRSWLRRFRFISPGSGKRCALTDLQRNDLGKLLSKPYCLINWEMGSGKTPAQYAFARHLLDTGATKTVFLVAPANAIEDMWLKFLDCNGETYTVLKRRSQIETVNTEGQFLVVSLSMIGRLKKPLQRLCRRLGQKAALILDESDELSNPLSSKTRATLAVFRRLHFKMLATGTTTRNNISEIYPQLELLYNNSVNFICECPMLYSYNKDGNLESRDNPYFLKPYPPRGGQNIFKGCHCPGKATVFGIEKLNQDIFESEVLWRMCEKTMITRRFKEFAGEKYQISTHVVEPTEAEMNVYETIVKDLYRVIPLYFAPQADTRKEAALRLVRLIDLLIRACSTPHTMPGYTGGDTLPTKTSRILRMLRERPDDKVMIGVTSLASLDLYRRVIAETFPERHLFVIDGSVSFKRRDILTNEFEATRDGILLCTQQSLKSSVNIPTCNEVIVESLQWNIPRIAQFFFRTIRFDSEKKTNVHFLIYRHTIEQNIMRLLLAKQTLNEFIKDGEVGSEEDSLAELGIEDGALDELVGKEYDKDGKLYFTWGGQRIA